MFDKVFQVFNLYLLSITISSISQSMSSITSMRHMSSFNLLTDGLGDLVVDILTGHLGHSVAVLNLNWDSLHLGVINTVLGGNLTASMLDSGLNRVGNSSSSQRGNVVSSVSSEELRISFSISLTLTNGMVTKSWCVTDLGDNILADLLVLNLLGVNCLLGADILGGWNTFLGHKNIHLSLAVGSRKVVWGSSEELGISLSLRGRGSTGKGEDARNGKNLHF